MTRKLAKQFTPADIEAWRKYERVREGGAWNMFDSRARGATGLSEERYLFVLENFSELQALADKDHAHKA